MKKIIACLMILLSSLIYGKSIFRDVGYFKTKQGIPKISRSFTVYTNSTSKKEMIEYARSKFYTDGGATLVHFFNNDDMTPQNSTITNYEVGMYLEGATDYYPYMIGTYQKGLKGNENWWPKNAISVSGESEEIKKFEENHKKKVKKVSPYSKNYKRVKNEKLKELSLKEIRERGYIIGIDGEIRDEATGELIK